MEVFMPGVFARERHAGNAAERWLDERHVLLTAALPDGCLSARLRPSFASSSMKASNRRPDALLDGYAARALGDRERLLRMEHFAQAVECRTKMVLEYFGESVTGACNRCDVCIPRGMS